MPTTQLEGQLSIFDILNAEEQRLTEGRAYIAAEEARTPDADRDLTCPWCGTTDYRTANHARVFHGWHEVNGKPGVCGAMMLTRNHVLYTLNHYKTPQEHDADKNNPQTFAHTMQRAYTLWGDKAREFIPQQYWEIATKRP